MFEDMIIAQPHLSYREFFTFADAEKRTKTTKPTIIPGASSLRYKKVNKGGRRDVLLDSPMGP